ncbi:hypothetical protein ES703_106979 [subsurface metagenome]
MSRLSTPLQIGHLKTRFRDLNPSRATDLIDWEHTIDETLTMGENVDVFIEEYPQFRWEKPEAEAGMLYEKQIVDEARAQVAEFSYDVIKSSRLGALQKVGERLLKTRINLEKCQGLRPKRKPRPKVTCKPSEKVEVCFWRCPR